jgi:prepilin-type N-terminal cleavage/methylation domain-containing protein
MKKRSAFTLVEILTAVAIIAILIGMAVMSYKYVTRNSRADQGRMALEAAKMVLTEFEGAGGSMSYLTGVGGLYHVPGNKPPAYLELPVKDPTTDMSPDGANRHGPEALRNARAMRILARTGDVRMRLFNLPDAVKTYLEYKPGLTYAHGDELKVGDAYYRYAPTSVTATTTSAPPSADWVAMQKEKLTPMLMDGEGNLILFVPGDGLVITLMGGPKQRLITTSPAPVPMNAASETLTGKSYFVAPGPDADYTTGEDNVYSFR